ncbi:MAG TPA: EAL domain-containing protein [Planctomycetota bacterium]|nr:EAL domain-containing protein [Planctomycetota bacterium]
MDGLSEAAAQDHLQLLLLLDALEDRIYFKDRQSKFLRINQALAARFGLANPAQAVGKSDVDFFPRDFAQRTYECEQQIIKTGKAVVDLEEHTVWADKTEAWTLVTKMPYRDARGQIIGTFGLSRDITEHKKAEEALRTSMALYHSLVQNLPQNIFRKDLEGRFTFANTQFCATIGKRLEEVLGRTDYDLFTAALARKYQEDDRKIIKSGKTFETVEEHHPPGKDLLYVRVVKTPIQDARGYVVGVQGMFWDVTDLHHAQKALESSEQRYALAAAGANDGLWDWDLRTGEVYYGPRWKSMLGFQEDEIGKSPEEWMKRVHPADLEKLKTDLASHVLGKTAHFENEHRMLHRDGGYRWMLSRGIGVRARNGKAIRLAGSQTDITDRKRFEEQLAQQAFYDALTGLPNRALFIDRLALAVTRARRRKSSMFSILFLDVDRFKDVNDSLGHLKGDLLLTAIARRLETCVRPGDTVARLGGDEFTILLDDMRDPADAVQVADRILEQMRMPFVLEGHEVFATVSIGIAPGAHYDKSEDLLRDADTAMYRAKERGKNCYEVFDAGMHSRAVARLQLETDLRKAIERKEFRVYYQPIVSLLNDGLVGFEALVRWQHPQKGLVTPGEFLPLAEETGLILPIDLWVLREAARQTKEWQDRYPQVNELRINVNLSTKQFSQPGLVDRVKDVLAQTGLDGRHLTLEITESAIMEETQALAGLLEQLRKMDIRLYLDDFGTGYSSLGYLHRFPIHSLKIHSSFVGQLGKEAEDPGQLVRTITTLAENMSMGVVAEGVETREQLTKLRDLRCERVQGYFFSRPLSAVDAELLLAKGPVWANSKR